MTSKNSFWASLKANAKRRIWLAVAMLLYFFFAFPVCSAMTISSDINYYTLPDLPEKLVNTFSSVVGLNCINMVFIAFLAIIAGVQGFSYMYQRKKLDLYLSVPVSKSKRFAAIYANSILIFVFAYLINLALSFFTSAAMGVDSIQAMSAALFGFLGNLLLFMGVYHVTILAVMLTGNLIITLLATGVLLSYDALAIVLCDAYKSTFFKSYTWLQKPPFEQLVVSPVVRMMMLKSEAYIYDSGTDRGTMDNLICLKGYVPVLLIGLVVLALAYFCYCKKPSEACTKSIAFSKIKAPVKILVVVMAALGSGICFYGFSGQSTVMCILGLILGVLLSHGIVEVIFDCDIRSVVHGWKTLIISAALTGIIFSIFKFDLTHYDSYVPDPGQIESCMFVFEDSYTDYYDRNMKNIGTYQYVPEHMKLTNAAPICELASRRMGNTYEDGRWSIVQYNLKNGRKVCRAFAIDYKEDAALLDQITAGKEYQEGVSPAYNDEFMSRADEMTVKYDNGSFVGELEDVSVKELLEAYKEDINSLSFTDSVKELVKGEITFAYLSKSQYVTQSLPVYASFDQTIAILKKENVYMDTCLNLADVQKIVVENSNSSLYPEDETTGENFDYDSYSKTLEITDPEEIKQVSDALYPSNYSNYWKPDGFIDGDYYVTVFYKSEGTTHKYSGYGTNYNLLAGKIPQFVKDKTVYGN